MCMDPTLVVQCSEQSPPLYLCVDCAHDLRHEHERKLIPVLKPLERAVSLKCENKVILSDHLILSQLSFNILELYVS